MRVVDLDSMQQPARASRPRARWFRRRAVGGALIALLSALLTGYVASNAITGALAAPGAAAPAFAPSAAHQLSLTELPLGDGKFTDAPTKGYVYSCMTTFQGIGAFRQGPWIDAANGTWNLEEKSLVPGEVNWPEAELDVTVDASMRTVTSKELPINHTTGIFPIQSDTEAYQYDRNPNHIAAHDVSLTVPVMPELLAEPACVGGEVGIALTGVLVFSAFDAGGRDAVATEVQDHCYGHPQAGSYYHYHGYSDCFVDDSAADEHSALIGYAFDGFGLFGLKGENGVALSSADLDECHGHSHAVAWDGQTVDLYHYHMTRDFPYSVSCFRAAPQVKGLSVGEGGPPP